MGLKITANHWRIEILMKCNLVNPFDAEFSSVSIDLQTDIGSFYDEQDNLVLTDRTVLTEIISIKPRGEIQPVNNHKQCELCCGSIITNSCYTA